MFVSFEEIKPLSVVREDLLRAKRLKELEDLLVTAEPVTFVGLTGRLLFAGEAPPF